MKLTDIKPSKRRPTRLAQKRPSSRVKLLINVRSMRDAKGVTMRDCSRASGIDAATYCRIENGLMPTLDNAIRFAAFVGMSVEKIWQPQ